MVVMDDTEQVCLLSCHRHAGRVVVCLTKSALSYAKDDMLSSPVPVLLSSHALRVSDLSDGLTS
jgi:hypothetical protein